MVSLFFGHQIVYENTVPVKEIATPTRAKNVCSLCVVFVDSALKVCVIVMRVLIW